MKRSAELATIETVCSFCGKNFFAKRRSAKFCPGRCKLDAFFARRALQQDSVPHREDSRPSKRKAAAPAAVAGSRSKLPIPAPSRTPKARPSQARPSLARSKKGGRK